MNSQIKKRVTLRNKHGLHARPATKFVELAKRFSSDILIAHQEEEVDGKSIISLLTLGLAKGAKMTIKAVGDDAQQAVDALVDLIKNPDLE